MIEYEISDNKYTSTEFAGYNLIVSTKTLNMRSALFQGFNNRIG